MNKVSTSPHVLIVEDNRQTAYYLRQFFEADNMQVTTVESGIAAKQIIESSRFSIVLLDQSLPDISGLEILQFCKSLKPMMPVIMHTGHEDTQLGFEFSKAGADAYIPKGGDFKIIRDTVAKLLITKHAVVKTNYDGLVPNSPINTILGSSSAILSLKDQIIKFAQTNAPVFIYGESGVGKSLVANALHAHSKRKNNIFFKQNGGVGTDELFDSTFFGHRKGAFTGADKDREGILRYVSGGTLFLDEIANLTIRAQMKLLCAIEEKTFTPLNSNEVIKTDIRLITATNKNVHRAIQEGEFMEDFFHRISTLVLYVPPLNQRREDIPELALHYINEICAQEESELKMISPVALDLLMTHDWSNGNVRLLSNVLYNAIVTAGKDADAILPQHLTRLKFKF